MQPHPNSLIKWNSEILPAEDGAPLQAPPAKVVEEVLQQKCQVNAKEAARA